MSSAATGDTSNNNTYLAMALIRQKHIYFSYEDVDPVTGTSIMGSIGESVTCLGSG